MKIQFQRTFFLVLTLGAFLSSCSGTNQMEGRDSIRKDRGEHQTSRDDSRSGQVSLAKDLDGDGLAKRDQRPRIADFPRAIVGEVDSSEIRFEKEDDSTSAKDSLDKKDLEKERKRRLRQQILNLHYKKIVSHSGRQLKNLLDFQDLMTSPLLRWRNQNYYPFLHRLQQKEFFPYGASLESLIKLRLRGMKGIKAIHNVKYRVGKKSFSEKRRLIDADGNPERFYIEEKKGEIHPKVLPIMDVDNESVAMKEVIRKRQTPRFRIEDFSYEREGKSLQFAETLAKIQKKCALMIVSSPKTPMKYAYVLAGDKVGETFKAMHEGIELSQSGHVNNLDGLQNALSVPVDISKLQKEDLKANTLQLMGATSANATAEPGKTYILSSANTKDITKFYTSKEEKRYETQKPEVKLGKAYPGDILTIKLSIDRKVPYRKKGRKKISYKGTRCTVHNADGIGLGQTTCHSDSKRQNVRWWKRGWKNQRISFTKDSLAHIKIKIGRERFKLSNLLLNNEAPAIYAGKRKVAFQIQVPKSLNRKKTVALRFDFPKKRKTLRLGFAGGFSCPGKYRGCERKFSTGKKSRRYTEKHIHEVTVKY